MIPLEAVYVTTLSISVPYIVTTRGTWFIGSIWIRYWIYLPLVHTTRNYTLQITNTHRLVSTIPLALSWQRLLPRKVLQFLCSRRARWLTLHIWTHSAIFSAYLPEPNSRLTAHLERLNSTDYSESEFYVTTDGQSTSLSWNKASIWGLWPDFYYCQTVAGLLMWGAFSDERMGLSLLLTPHQRSYSRVQVPWDLWPYLLSQIRDFRIRRLLRLAGLRWRYSTPPPHGLFLPLA
jgi:hypothetical protein